MILVYLLIIVLTISILVSMLGTLLLIVTEERTIDTKQISAECIEIAVLIYLICTYIPGWLPSRPKRHPNPTKNHRPILLVPGYGLNRLSMYFLSVYLRRLGYEWIWAINHPVWKDDVHDFATSLDEKIRWYCHYTQAEEVTVIAHSMGGIVSNLAMQKYHSPISALFTIGTPWRGTKMHILGIGKHVHQLASTHPVIQNMVVPTVPHLSVWSRQDWILLPNENAIMDALHHKEVSYIGHMSLLVHTKTLQLLHQFLHEQEKTTDPLRHW